MRDTAGSAAAPAARRRKFRRGSFILNLPSHHSITSSARPSSRRVIPLVDAVDGKSTRQIAAEGVIGHLAAPTSDDREGVRQKTPGGKIVKRRHEETVSEISRSAENDQAAWAGRRSHIGRDLVHYGSAASQCVDVLQALRQRHFKPAFAAILSAEH